MPDLYTATYNPDVLSCIANLSSDEVFTPPEVANAMLDMLPQELFTSPHTTFLDPAAKSGVFLREIAKRLLVGLAPVIPDLQARIDHIFHKQLFGIAITELTGLLSRRSVYCSKYANSPYAVSPFDKENVQGNIRFVRTPHQWVNKRCAFCGVSEDDYGEKAREGIENHAYEFIHTLNARKIFNMKFDVIIGNPPYQLSDGGAQKSASPLYHKFIQQAKKLRPRYLTMIVPARWYSGGKGLDDFRNEMLNDTCISEIHDFPETSDCFPGVNIRGGICYFLWDRDHKGMCHVVNHRNGKIIDESTRMLKEKNAMSFVRYNKAIGILHKVQAYHEETMDLLVSARKPFGLETNYSMFDTEKSAEKNIKLYRFGCDGYVSINDIRKNASWVNQWKVLEPYASPGADDYPHLILSKPIVAGIKTACTETYLVIGPFSSEQIANNVATYMRSRFFRFMVMLLKSTQHITQKVYAFVPMQDFSRPWTDGELYRKYGLTEEEIAFIESMIKPMELGGEEA